MSRQRRLDRPPTGTHYWRATALAGGMVGGALFVGMLGYHFLNGEGWIDAFLDASMILGGMGPVGTMQNNAAKLFAGCYALFSGLVFIGQRGGAGGAVAPRPLAPPPRRAGRGIVSGA